MPFQFQKFTDVRSSYAARVTIRQTGQLGFNGGAIRRFKLKDYRFAVLYWDPERRAIGIEPSEIECEGAIELKATDSNNYLRAKNFLDLYEIDYSRSHRYELRRDEQTGFLYFELDKELESDLEEETEANGVA